MIVPILKIPVFDIVIPWLALVANGSSFETKENLIVGNCINNKYLHQNVITVIFHKLTNTQSINIYLKVISIFVKLLKIENKANNICSTIPIRIIILA